MRNSGIYSLIAPGEKYDVEKIDVRLKEIAQELAACDKLKPQWRAEVRSGPHHWHDDHSNSPVQIEALDQSSRTWYTIASGTIYDTQRELFFMAAMREAFPEVLLLERTALVQLRQALVAQQRRRRRKS
jgi:hypothetical protein